MASLEGTGRDESTVAVRQAARNRLADLLLVLVIVATAAIYMPVLRYDFVDDDILQIVRNPLIRSWESLPKYFGSAWSHTTLTPGMPSPAYYRPVFLIWLRAGYQLFGPSPAAFHAAALLAHLVVVVLVYLMVSRLSDDRYTGILAAFLFALHPTHIEAVTWISGATESLLAIPLLASLLCYMRFREPGRPRLWGYAAVALYAVAVFSKETALIFPAVVGVYHWLFATPAPESRWRRLRLTADAVLPYVIVAVLCVAARSLAGVSAQATHTEISTAVLVFTLPSVLWFYVMHLVWPFGLSTVYDLPYYEGLNVRGVLLPLLGISLIACGLYVWSKHHRLAAFASWWMILLILPALYIRVFPPREVAHDRYLYLPSMGFCLLLTLLVHRVLSRRSPRILRVATAGATAAVAVAWAGGVIVQNQPWRDDIALFRRAYEIAPNHPRALRQLAMNLARLDRCLEAIPYLTESLAREPHATVYYSLGICYYKFGRLPEAESALHAAIGKARDFQEVYVLLAIIRLQQRRIGDAEAMLAAADRARHSGYIPPGLHLVRGSILADKGQFRSAAEHFRTEIAYVPPIFREMAQSQLELLRQIAPVSAGP
jgi:tetratricopeptide (TPR) repeat protein